MQSTPPRGNYIAFSEKLLHFFDYICSACDLDLDLIMPKIVESPMTHPIQLKLS